MLAIVEVCRTTEQRLHFASSVTVTLETAWHCIDVRATWCCDCQVSQINALDMELEVLQKQMEAALRLSEDKSLAKNIRRKHRQAYHDTHHKVRCVFTINGSGV